MGVLGVLVLERGSGKPSLNREPPGEDLEERKRDHTALRREGIPGHRGPQARARARARRLGPSGVGGVEGSDPTGPCQRC